MEVDLVEETLQSSVSHQAPHSHHIVTVPVDDAHPFDLEGYVANYSGRTVITRLIHIVHICPSIASEAFNLAVQHIHQSRDPLLYQQLLSTYEVSGLQGALPPVSDLKPLDTNWADSTMAKNQAEKLKLEVELKSYTNNMIKESIRMGHRDLGDFHRSLGDFATALKHYTKSREFCTTSQHVLDMCLSVLELLIEQKNYSHLPTYVFKADAALDAANSAATATQPATTTIGGKKRSPERDSVQTKLDFATALSNLGQGSYEKAAFHFLKLGPPKELGDWAGKLVAPGDIAIYGTLCALATYSRSALKAQVLDNADFSIYIEQEPYIRELVESYMSSNFKTVLELLTRYSTRHYIDIHLAGHVHDLTALIRNWAIVLYFQPFSSIKLSRMSTAFGWTIDQVEKHVVDLIQSGEIKARVDSQNKILQAKQTDYRADLFARSIKAAKDIQSANRKLLLRMRLQQADLIVKPPKGHHGLVMEYMQGE
ncbi:PCI-domain-containing protein [Pluteus cervinus]|uniref:PCI-domain-containing protein n=1 Tax=Pluteus cervinus TaxID=181527 RepID=A0ACD3ARI4_9AGAR|nr:PCI-domain-containing protein [Pluteus cervinus]